MLKPELIDQVAAATGLPKHTAHDVVTAFTDQITQSLMTGNPVTLIGFGRFTRRHRAERSGRDPKTGEPITVKAHHTVVFRAGKALRNAMAE